MYARASHSYQVNIRTKRETTCIGLGCRFVINIAWVGSPSKFEWQKLSPLREWLSFTYQVNGDNGRPIPGIKMKCTWSRIRKQLHFWSHFAGHWTKQKRNKKRYNRHARKLTLLSIFIQTNQTKDFASITTEYPTKLRKLDYDMRPLPPQRACHNENDISIFSRFLVDSNISNNMLILLLILFWNATVDRWPNSLNNK